VRRQFKWARHWPRGGRRPVILATSRRHVATTGAKPLDPVPRQLTDNMAGIGEDMLIASVNTSLQSLYDTIPVALGVIDREGRYVAANGMYARLHGRAPQALIGREVNDFIPGAGERLRKDFADFDAGLDVMDREITCHGRHFLVALQAVRDADGSVQGVTSVLIDITARKRMEEASEEASRHWQFHASHDHLTGLANRRRIDDAIATEAQRCMRNGAALSVLMMDVDYFKPYNDHAGHQRGDECLRAIAARLRARVRRHGDLVGRYGGEEFIAVLPDTDAAGAQLVARHILEDIRALAIWHPGSPYDCVTMSIGVASLGELPPSRLECREVLLNCADRALYAAKAAGRNTVYVYPSR
jgi:diguanylate cyclase (GGDEF)-like protein/PAS domain S-box-containing protein